MSSKDFVFVGGYPRSGTTLMAGLMRDVFNICLPSETHYMCIFQPYLFLWGSQGKAKNRRALLKSISQFMDIRNAAISRGNLEDLERITLTIPRQSVDELVENHTSYAAINTALFDNYARSHGLTRSGDKTVYYYPYPVTRQGKCLENMRVLHIMRDPRDACLSARNIWWGPRAASTHAWLWKNSVSRFDTWARSNPRNYLRMRYEDLLDAPGETMQRIADYLGEPLKDDWESCINSCELHKVQANIKHHSLLGKKSIESSNKYKWKNAMSQADLAVFNRICPEELERFGYEPGTDAKAPLATCVAGVVRDMLTKSAVMRGSKMFVLPALWAASKVGADEALTGFLSKKLAK